MTDKEFRHLRRAELIEIIFKLQESEASLQAEIASLKEQLEARELKLAEAGSIAEAAMQVNGVFEAAQAAADQYVAETQKMQAEARRRTEQMLADAQAQKEDMLAEAAERLETAKEQQQALISEGQTQHDGMIAEAQARHDAMIADAEQEVTRKWQELEEKLLRTLETHAELRSAMESLQERR